MKRLWLLLSLAASLSAQTTTVTATVVDSDTVAWAGGEWKLDFTPSTSNPNPAVYRVNGATLNPVVAHQTGLMDGSGYFTASMYTTSTITPTGSTWRLTVCPNASALCGYYSFVAAASGDISTSVNAVITAPRFTAISGTYGYTNLEASLKLIPGSTYFNVSTNCQRLYNGASWTCPTSSVVGTGDLVNQTTSQGPFTLVPSTLTTAQYRINYNIGEHALCTGGFISVVLNFTWYDPISQRSAQSITLTTGPTQSIPSGSIQGVIPIYAQGSTAITYSSTVTSSCATGGPASYDAHITVEEIQ